MFYIMTIFILMNTDNAYGLDVNNSNDNAGDRSLLDLVVSDPPSESNMFFYVFTPTSFDQLQRLPHKPTVDDLKKVNFLFNKDIVVYTHGFRIRPATKPWVIDFVRNWAKKFKKNAIMVDWSKSSGRHNYYKAIKNVPLVARKLADFLTVLSTTANISLNSIHLIGHSLGSHISGYTGKFLNGKIGRITGLDPAGPKYKHKDASIRLWYTDALFVETIHTDFSNPIYSLGTDDPCSHVNIYPNEGEMQPGCGGRFYFLILKQQKVRSCNHKYAFMYYNELMFGTLEGPQIAYKCENNLLFRQGNCSECDEKKYNCFRLGEQSPEVLQEFAKTPLSKYYLNTTYEMPAKESGQSDETPFRRMLSSKSVQTVLTSTLIFALLTVFLNFQPASLSL